MRKTFYKLGYGLAFFLIVNMQNSLSAQDPRLAREYYASGEYEKAAEIYKRLHEQDRNQDYYYERYLATLMDLQDYKNAEDMLKKAIKHNPKKLDRYIDYGFLYKRLGEKEKEKEQYEKVIKQLDNALTDIAKLAENFVAKKEYDFALLAYEKGEKILKQPKHFSYEMAAIHNAKGDKPKMIAAYLDALDYNPNRLTNIQAFFQRSMATENNGYVDLKKELLQRIQKDNTNMIYPEMLIWVYTQEGDYNSAMRQSKAIDKRLSENGMRVFRLAQLAYSEKQYEAAIEGYKYIITDKTKESPYFLEASESILRAKRELLINSATYTQEDLKKLSSEYETYLKEFGHTRFTINVMRDFANFQARYLYDLEKAIAILEEIVKMPQVQRITLAEVKLELGDLYLMNADPWEATLLYSQVDKDQKDSPMGEMARFKNAKLAYYRGDFEWAQSQLEIIKGATSELTANDAIELSVFIMEHLNLDTTAAAMKLFSDADLLRFQNRDDDAIQKMDSIPLIYKGHGLEDDVLYAKAQIAYKKRDYKKAAEYYSSIIANYKEGILMDNALFKLAELYENQLNDTAKAMELYDTIILDYSSSLFIVEARKRYRHLRGDNLP